MLEYFIVSLADVYTMILFVYVLMSWIPQKSGIIADIDIVLGRVCDPFLNLFRKFIPPIGGMVDISPIFALLVLQFAVRLIVMIL
ncbi:YggT family protein [Slackia piriformis]|uniref:YggT family protein n=1 Tax=Slackia piriformis TaxID=626934 RepID=UPI0023F13CDA|nr:YggT family protein [Slackia piriformis]